MGAINKVTVMGQLGKAPRWGALPSGVAACSLMLTTTTEDEDAATGRPRRCTEWHRVVLEGALAEQVRGRVATGDEVYLEGKLRTRKWTDAGGVVRYCTEIRADAVQVFPQRHTRTTALDDDDIRSWVADYDATTAREAIQAAGKADALRKHREGKRARAVPANCGL